MEPPELDRLKDEANTHMVEAALMAAMTSGSGFEVPGGYDGSELYARIAILLKKAMYDVFVIHNPIAMYSSIVALVILLWSQINDPYAERNALLKARLPLLMPLAAMLVAFTASVYVTATKLAWVAIVILVMGTIAALIILSVYLMLYVPHGYANPFIRRFTNLIIVASNLISGSVTAGNPVPGRATTSSGGACDNNLRLHLNR